MKTEIPQYIQNPQLRITVTVFGAGGTGVMFLQELARIQYSLEQVYNKQLHVTVVDPDIITDANLGRQYTPSEIGMMKATAICSRINRMYGFDWLAYTEVLDMKRRPIESTRSVASNILVTCTDTVSSRREVEKLWKYVERTSSAHELIPYFWIDCGNTKTSGQVIVGSSQMGWPTSLDMYGDRMIDEPNEPSCTLAVALDQQDLFVNRDVAAIAAKWLWQALKGTEIDWRGAFVNCDTMMHNKIKVKQNAIINTPAPSVHIHPAAQRKANGKAKRRLRPNGTRRLSNQNRVGD